jgi:hypothetical protein
MSNQAARVVRSRRGGPRLVLFVPAMEKFYPLLRRKDKKRNKGDHEDENND